MTFKVEPSSLILIVCVGEGVARSISEFARRNIILLDLSGVDMDSRENSIDTSAPSSLIVIVSCLLVCNGYAETDVGEVTDSSSYFLILESYRGFLLSSLCGFDAPSEGNKHLFVLSINSISLYTMSEILNAKRITTWTFSRILKNRQFCDPTKRNLPSRFEINLKKSRKSIHMKTFVLILHKKVRTNVSEYRSRPACKNASRSYLYVYLIFLFTS